MTNLKRFLERDIAPRPSSAALQSLRENTGDLGVIHSLGLDAATIALPAGIPLKERAARMNEFWEKLVDFQRRDVLVVAICAPEDR